MANTYFTPIIDAFRIEESVIPGEPLSIAEENARMPIMLGVTSAESGQLMGRLIGWLDSVFSGLFSKIILYCLLLKVSGYCSMVNFPAPKIPSLNILRQSLPLSFPTGCVEKIQCILVSSRRKMIAPYWHLCFL